jgi:hypothetical protein
MPLAKVEQANRLKRNVEKWSPELMEAGWTVVPSILLEKQDTFGLDAIDMNILLQLARYWWYPDNPPHPSKAAIAKALGIHESTVRRRIAGMEKSNFIRRVARFNKLRGQDTNSYHFDGLITAAKPFALEAKQEREKQASEREERKTRRRPLSIVPLQKV